jgi:hypothetical protein
MRALFGVALAARKLALLGAASDEGADLRNWLGGFESRRVHSRGGYQVNRRGELSVNRSPGAFTMSEAVLQSACRSASEAYKRGALYFCCVRYDQRPFDRLTFDKLRVTQGGGAARGLGLRSGPGL